MDDTWRSELAEFISIPSVSADAAHREDVKRAGEWVCDFIRKIGGSAELTPIGEQELVELVEPVLVGSVPHGARVYAVQAEGAGAALPEEAREQARDIRADRASSFTGTASAASCREPCN